MTGRLLLPATCVCDFLIFYFTFCTSLVEVRMPRQKCDLIARKINRNQRISWNSMDFYSNGSPMGPEALGIHGPHGAMGPWAHGPMGPSHDPTMRPHDQLTVHTRPSHNERMVNQKHKAQNSGNTELHCIAHSSPGSIATTNRVHESTSTRQPTLTRA